MSARQERFENPVHTPSCPPEVLWSTRPLRRLVPGVFTPLRWSIWGDPVDRALKRSLHAAGVLRRDQVMADEAPELRLWDAFHGRPAINVSRWRWAGDRLTSGGGGRLERALLGDGAVELPRGRVRVRARLAGAVPLTTRRARQAAWDAAQQTGAWARAGGGEAVRRLEEAVERFEPLVTILGTVALQALRGDSPAGAGELREAREAAWNAVLEIDAVAAAAAAQIGTELAAAGVLGDRSDSQMLLVEELLASRQPTGIATRAAARRAHHEHHLAVELPDTFRGCPVPERAVRG
jgi:hypothetical protein